MTELARHNLVLYSGDLDRLRAYYGDRFASQAVRNLVREHLDKLDEATTQEEFDFN